MDYIGIVKKTDSITDALRREILSGHLPGGTELTQKELAEALGVSRMPVREALIVMEYQGLMERLPNNHMRITPITEEYFREIFSLCASMETKYLQAWGVRGSAPQPFTARAEADFHRQIYLHLPAGFPRSTMQTLVDVYVDYALGYSDARAREILSAVADGTARDTEACLRRYFDRLTDNIMKAR